MNKNDYFKGKWIASKFTFQLSYMKFIFEIYYIQYSWRNNNNNKYPHSQVRKHMDYCTYQFSIAAKQITISINV